MTGLTPTLLRLRDLSAATEREGSVDVIPRNRKVARILQSVDELIDSDEKFIDARRVCRCVN